MAKAKKTSINADVSVIKSTRTINESDFDVLVFHGTEIQVVRNGPDDLWIPLIRLCRILGLDYSAQYRKLKSKANEHWVVIVDSTITAADGRPYQTLCVNLETLSGWLLKIPADQVKATSREIVKLYQKECVRVLRRHFFPSQPAATQVAVVPDRDPLLERIVSAIEIIGRHQSTAEARIATLDERLNMVVDPESPVNQCLMNAFTRIDDYGSRIVRLEQDRADGGVRPANLRPEMVTTLVKAAADHRAVDTRVARLESMLTQVLANQLQPDHGDDRQVREMSVKAFLDTIGYQYLDRDLGDHGKRMVARCNRERLAVRYVQGDTYSRIGLYPLDALLREYGVPMERYQELRARHLAPRAPR